MLFFTAVHDDLQALSDYVKVGKYEHASKEDSWTIFHKNLNTVNIRNLSPVDGRFLALEVFNSMLNRIWYKPVSQTESSHILEEEHSVLAYIAGSNIKQLKNKVQLQAESKVLQLLCCEESEACNASLTCLMDRGGLTYITEGAFKVYNQLELVFRSTDSKDNYKKRVLESTMSSFDELVKNHEDYDINEIPDEAIDNTLSLIMDKYFTTRIHHRCKILSQAAVSAKKVGRQSKGLRKSLKSK